MARDTIRLLSSTLAAAAAARFGRETGPARGVGRGKPATRLVDPAGLGEQLRRLCQDQRLTRAQTADRLGLSEEMVRTSLAEHSIPTRTRGRFNREDRRDIDGVEVTALYSDAELTAHAVAVAVAVAEKLSVAPGIAFRSPHDHGVPVRPGAATPQRAAIELIDALYGDPIVARTPAEYQVPVVSHGAPIWERFPTPVPLSVLLVSDLYLGSGVTVTHIGCFTGQPAASVRRSLRSAGVPLRPAGGRCPFLRRWSDQHRRVDRTQP